MRVEPAKFQPMPRDLRRGWCPEGISLYDAIDALGIDAYRSAEVEFAEAHPTELRAAQYLAVFTGLDPRWRDRDALQAAVDIELRAPNDTLELAEVTSTLSRSFEQESRRVERLMGMVKASYTGETNWLFHLQRGWATPKNLNTFAAAIARELESYDAEGRHDGHLLAADTMFVRRDDGETGRGASIASWSTNVPEPSDEPYLDRLSNYLRTSSLIAGKREKLQRESQTLGASRRHLYLWVTLSGEDGALFPKSPSDLTRGSFGAPAELTDVWLDGGSGELFHWSDTTGWVFHRLRPAPTDDDWLFEEAKPPTT